MSNHAIPEGFESASNPPGNHDCVQVLYAPAPKQTHYEIATARHHADRREGARWRTPTGDRVDDFGHEVIAWRRIPDSMRVRNDRSRKDDAYDLVIQVLANEAAILGAGPDDPVSGIELTSRVFGIPEDEVRQDLLARRGMTSRSPN